MTRAIEKAMEEFPIVGDLHLRNAYISGYHQAEKDLADAFQAEYAKELARADLALAWEDIKMIHDIFIDLADDEDFAPLSNEFYEEVLRRFREMKDK